MAVEDAARSRVGEPLPPHNTDAEEAVLGSLLLHPDSIHQIATILRPEDFYIEANGQTYRAMLSLYEKHRPIDYLSLTDELQRLEIYDRAGGLAYISALLNVVPTFVHVEEYARIVERTAFMRRLIEAAGKIAQLGYSDADDPQKILDKAEQALFSVAQRRATRDFESLSSVLRQYWEEIQFVHSGEPLRHGIPTGFIDFDKLTGGLQRSDLIVVAARPAMGKTSLALNIAHNAAVRFGATVAIFSLEMSRTQLAQRVLCSEAGVDSARLRQGKFSDGEARKLTHALGTLAEAPIYVDDTPAISIMDIRSKARRLHAEVGIDLMIVDYLQLAGGSRADNRVQEISEISRSLKALARELHIPILAISQLSRAVESRSPHIPMLSDLRESGSIEQDADVVAFIYRDEMYNRDTEKKGIAEIHVAKHRNGPTDKFSLLFRERTTKFLDLAEFRGERP